MEPPPDPSTHSGGPYIAGMDPSFQKRLASLPPITIEAPQPPLQRSLCSRAMAYTLYVTLRAALKASAATSSVTSSSLSWLTHAARLAFGYTSSASSCPHISLTKAPEHVILSLDSSLLPAHIGAAVAPTHSSAAAAAVGPALPSPEEASTLGAARIVSDSTPSSIADTAVSTAESVAAASTDAAAADISAAARVAEWVVSLARVGVDTVCLHDIDGLLSPLPPASTPAASAAQGRVWRSIITSVRELTAKSSIYAPASTASLRSSASTPARAECDDPSTAVVALSGPAEVCFLFCDEPAVIAPCPARVSTAAAATAAAAAAAAAAAESDMATRVAIAAAARCVLVHRGVRRRVTVVRALPLTPESSAGEIETATGGELYLYSGDSTVNEGACVALPSLLPPVLPLSSLSALPSPAPCLVLPLTPASARPALAAAVAALSARPDLALSIATAPAAAAAAAAVATGAVETARRRAERALEAVTQAPTDKVGTVAARAAVAAVLVAAAGAARALACASVGHIGERGSAVDTVDTAAATAAAATAAAAAAAANAAASAWTAAAAATAATLPLSEPSLLLRLGADAAAAGGSDQPGKDTAGLGAPLSGVAPWMLRVAEVHLARVPLASASVRATATVIPPTSGAGSVQNEVEIEEGLSRALAAYSKCEQRLGR